MRFLALDTSKSRTGWASWETGDAKPVLGHFQCGSEYTSDGSAQKTLWRNLLDITAFGMPDIMGVEAPADASKWKGGRPFQHTKTLIRLAGTVMFFAENYGIRASEIPKDVWFPPFIGPNQRPPKGEAKSYCEMRCKSLGLRPLNDDEADAVGILDYMISLEQIIPPWREENLLLPVIGRAA